MSVTFRLVNHLNKNYSNGFIDRICFGPTLYGETIDPFGYLHNFDFLEYKKFDSRGAFYSEDFYKEIVERLPWIKNIVERKSKDVFSFDLSKPADTVWFCLNLIRCIFESPFQMGRKFSESFLKISEGTDIWSKIILLNSVNFGSVFSNGKNGEFFIGYPISSNSTCLISPMSVSIKTLESFLKDPLLVLNKLPSVKESKTGFLLKCSKEVDYLYSGQSLSNHRWLSPEAFSSVRTDHFKYEEHYNSYASHWRMLDVMDDVHLVDEFPRQFDGIKHSYKNFKSFKDYYLFLGFKEERFSDLFVDEVYIKED